MKSIVPYAADKTQFFKQYRALILFLLHPRFNYDQLIDGSGTLKDSLSKQIQKANTINEIDKIIGDQIIREKAKREKENKLVTKKVILCLSGLVLGSLFLR